MRYANTLVAILFLAGLVSAQPPATPAKPAGPGPGAPRNFQPPAPPKQVTITAIPGVIAANVQWKKAWEGPATADGMAGTDDGGLLFAQEQTNMIGKIDKDDKFSVYASAWGPGGVGIGSDGRLFVVERTCTDPGLVAMCTVATDVAVLTPERKVLADSVQGKGLGRVNDLTVAKNGSAYFTSGGAFYMNPSGQVMPIGENLRTNGILLSRDEKTLYITNGATVAALDVQPDGSVKNQREFGKLEGGGGGDGMAIDSEGRLYVTGGPGVQVLGADGKYLGAIPTPRAAITVAFSGPDKKTLYVGTMGVTMGNGKEYVTDPTVRNTAMTVYKIQMQAQGFKGRAK